MIVWLQWQKILLRWDRFKGAEYKYRADLFCFSFFSFSKMYIETYVLFFLSFTIIHYFVMVY